MEVMRILRGLSLSRLEGTTRLEANVIPYKKPVVRRCMTSRVFRVVSPFEFYLEYVLDDDDVVPYMDKDWFDQMQKFYDDPSNVEKWTPVSEKHFFKI